ncbi:MAG: DNA polymerase III subunit beta [Oscillospiraceae bacterium]|jgi:DNA polymerase-3 subunit beta|nr:DNA polymerase III subunit beta [Oscillospiraceae bacterium]
MKFTCEKALLVSAISIAGRTVAQKSAIACLEGIHLRAGAQLQLTGFNLETGITVKVAAQVQRAGACVMPARLFFDIVRKMPDDIVQIAVDENLKVSISGGASSFQISAMDAEDYPDLPEVDAQAGVSMPQGELREMIGGTIFAVSDNQARPIHTGCLFEVTNEAVSIIAVDSFRLARRTWKSGAPTGREQKFVVPGAALKEVEKILSDSDEEVHFSLGAKHILFSVGDATLVCRLLEGEFIDWRRVVPTDSGTILTANVAQLTAAIERVSLIVSEKVKSPVRCLFSENMADFRTNNTIGSAHDTCAVAGNGGELEIGFNCRYLLDALRAVPSEEVTLELQNGLSPVVFTPCDDKYNFAYMVLPVRLQAK